MAFKDRNPQLVERPVDIEGLITAETDTDLRLAPDGAGGVEFAAGGDGHTIRENGTDQTDRGALNFIDADAGAGLITDDAGDDETEVNLDLYALLAGRSGGQTLIGGTGTTDDLILRTTSGVGATGADMIFQVGNNGATQAMKIFNNGRVIIGEPVSPAGKLHVFDTTGNLFVVELDPAAGSGIFGGAIFKVKRNTVGDGLSIFFHGLDADNTIKSYATIGFEIEDNTVGAHKGQFTVQVADGSGGVPTVLSINGDGEVTIDSLAGTGSRNVVADANGKLSAP